jgi:hypothetical protein
MATRQELMSCVTCGQHLSGEKDHPGYFAQSALQPRGCGDFLGELVNLLCHVRAVFVVLHTSSKDLEDGTVSDLYDLGWSLTEEAQRRLSLASGALNRQENDNQTASGREG